MVQFAAVLLRGVLAMFAGLLIAGGTLTLAADRAPVERPTLVAVSPPGTATLDVPDVTGQAYVFAKGILQDHGFAWHVTGPVLGYAANTVATQSPTPGATVVDNGAPTITLSLAPNPAYIERGTPENDAPYPGTAIEIPAGIRQRPTTAVKPRLEPVQAPGVATPSAVQTPAPAQVSLPSSVPVTTPQVTAPPAPKESARSQSLPDRVAALATWIESHRDPSVPNLNHWLYEHAYVVAGARFGWSHGVEALQALIEVDKRAEALWGVGSQSRMTAQKALAEVRTRAS